MKRAMSMFLTLALLLAGCAAKESKYAVTWYDTFDTVITLTVITPGEDQFTDVARDAHNELLRLHRIFDRYAPHEGVNGLWALNHAKGAWTDAEPELIELLQTVLGWQETYTDRVNVAMGNALEIWRAAREAGALPDADALEQSRAHTDASKIEIDAENGRVRLNDPEMTLDLGAVAKGYAAARVGKMIEARYPRFLLDAGGNVVAGEAPQGGPWRIGVQDPENADALRAQIKTSHLAVVTSGGYERFVVVDGVRYAHIIDPDTLYPGTLFLQTTVACEDSFLADFLSTALFLTPYEEGRALAERLGVSCLWVFPDGGSAGTGVFASEGAKS